MPQLNHMYIRELYGVLTPNYASLMSLVNLSLQLQSIASVWVNLLYHSPELL